VHRPHHDVTVELIFRAMTLKPQLLPRLLAADALPEEDKGLDREREEHPWWESRHTAASPELRRRSLTGEDRCPRATQVSRRRVAWHDLTSTRGS
jgi:hypothetical protein